MADPAPATVHEYRAPSFPSGTGPGLSARGADRREILAVRHQEKRACSVRKS
jgi:hypothetical protein